MDHSVEKLVKELEEEVSEIFSNVNTLKQIQLKFAEVRYQFQSKETSSEYVIFLANDPLLNIIDDLLFYTVQDLQKNYKEVSTLVERLVRKIVS